MRAGVRQYNHHQEPTEEQISEVIRLRNTEHLSFEKIALLTGLYQRQVYNVYMQNVPDKDRVDSTIVYDHSSGTSALLCGECEHWQEGERDIECMVWRGVCQIDGLGCDRCHICDHGFRICDTNHKRKKPVVLEDKPDYEALKAKFAAYIDKLKGAEKRGKKNGV